MTRRQLDETLVQQAMVEHLLTELTSGALEDDVALLVIRVL